MTAERRDRGRETPEIIGVRTIAGTHDQLRDLRAKLQAATPHGLVTIGDALTYAVGKAHETFTERSEVQKP